MSVLRLMSLDNVCFAVCEGLLLCLDTGIGFPCCSSVAFVWELMSIEKVFRGESSSQDPLALEDSRGRTFGWHVFDGLLLIISSLSFDPGVWDLLGLAGLS